MISRGVLKSSRQPGQGGEANHEFRDLKAELLQAEALHFAKIRGEPLANLKSLETQASQRTIEDGKVENGGEEGPEAKRRRILEESRDIDADSDPGPDNNSSSSEEDR